MAASAFGDNPVSAVSAERKTIASLPPEDVAAFLEESAEMIWPWSKKKTKEQKEEEARIKKEKKEKEDNEAARCHARKDSPYRRMLHGQKVSEMSVNKRNRMCRMCALESGCKFCNKDNDCARTSKFWAFCTGKQVTTNDQEGTAVACGKVYGCMNQKSRSFDPYATHQSIREDSCPCDDNNTLCKEENARLFAAAANNRSSLMRVNATK